MHMERTTRRMLVAVLAWVLGAVVAVSVGLVALSSIGDGFATASGPGTVGVVEPAVAQGGAGTPPDGVAGATTQAAGTPGTPGATVPARPHTDRAGTTQGAAPDSESSPRLLASGGGTVIARCAGGDVYLVSWSPAQGFHTATVRRGPSTQAMIAFTDGSHLITMTVQCRSGTPVASVSENDGGGDRRLHDD